MKKKLLVLVLVGVVIGGTFLFLSRVFCPETAAVESIIKEAPNENIEAGQGNMEIVVRKGWTLAEIAQGVGMELEEVIQLNNLASYDIYPGQILKVKPYAAFSVVLVSWYGPKYHGKKMANGEIFNMYNPTIVAHRWLPFGTQVRLTRIDTGAGIEVIVQDRGPYVTNRHFDLSYAAAQKLDMVEDGVVLCKVEVLDWPH